MTKTEPMVLITHEHKGLAPDAQESDITKISSSVLNEELAIDLDEALIMALENNRALKVQRFSPDLRRYAKNIAKGAFDPIVAGQVFERRVKSETHLDKPNVAERSIHGALGLALTRPFGTRLDFGLDVDSLTRSDDEFGSKASIGLALTQPLQRGVGREVNLVEVRQASLDTELSAYELRGTTEALVAQVEVTCWDYLMANQRLAIVYESLQLAERQQEETRQRIEVGSLPRTELAAAEAETALRKEALINARSQLASLRIRLIRIIQPERLKRADSAVILIEKSNRAASSLESIETHLASALAQRPDLNQARLLVQRGELDLVQTANGLLPRMDVFARLGKSGYADSFGRAVSNLDGEAYDVTVGLGIEWPVGNRVARNRHEQALLAQEQVEESLRNIEDLAREDVHIAYIEARRMSQQIDATSSTRQLQEEKLRAEMAKHAAGKSTTLLVAQAQRDLLFAQVAEIESATNYRKTLTNLYRLDGSLLERRGILAPGAERARVYEK